MKLICPHCGLGGTTDPSLFGRKARCPECRKVFMINDEVALSSPLKFPEGTGIIINEADFSTQGTGREGAEFAECSICGYTLSSKFLRTIGAKRCCTVCEPE